MQIHQKYFYKFRLFFLSVCVCVRVQRKFQIYIMSKNAHRIQNVCHMQPHVLWWRRWWRIDLGGASIQNLKVKVLVQLRQFQEVYFEKPFIQILYIPYLPTYLYVQHIIALQNILYALKIQVSRYTDDDDDEGKRGGEKIGFFVQVQFLYVWSQRQLGRRHCSIERNIFKQVKKTKNLVVNFNEINDKLNVERFCYFSILYFDGLAGNEKVLQTQQYV